MLQPLDLPTVLLLHKLSFFIGALCFMYVRSQSKESVGLGHLAAGFFLIATASTLSGIGKLVEGCEHEFALTGNLAGLVGYTTFWIGMCRISSQRIRQREWLVLLLPFTGCLVLLLTGLYATPVARTISFQLIAATLLSASAYTVLSDRLLEPLPARKALSIAIIAAAVLTLLVVVGNVLPETSVVLSRNSFFVAIVCHFAIAFFVMTLVKERAEERLRRLAELDVLTGVPNRHSFSSRLPDVMRQGDAIVMIDIDYFKRINDGFGHLAGDEVLARVARELSSRVRPIDSFARFGGEEFILYQPGIGMEEALAFADSTRQIVSAIKHNIDEQRVSATLSMGLAICEDKMSTPLALIKKADMALYASKASGRDQLTLYRAEDFESTAPLEGIRQAS